MESSLREHRQLYHAEFLTSKLDFRTAVSVLSVPPSVCCGETEERNRVAFGGRPTTIDRLEALKLGCVELSTQKLGI